MKRRKMRRRRRKKDKQKRLQKMEKKMQKQERCEWIISIYEKEENRWFKEREEDLWKEEE